VLPLSVFGKLTFQEISEILENRIIYSATQAFNQGTEYLSYKIDKIINVSDNIAVNLDVKNILQRDITNNTTAGKHEDLNYLRAYLSSFQDDKDIHNICIYVRDELLHSNEDDDISSISNAVQAKWYSQLTGAGSRVFMVPPAFYNDPKKNEGVILSVARRITSSTNYIEVIGYLRIDFLEKSIQDILSKSNSVSGSLTYIRNRDDRIVSATDFELLGTYRLSLADIKALDGVEDWRILTINDQATYVRTRTIKDTDWTIVTVIPSEDIFREVSNLSRLMVAFLIIIIPIALGFSIFLSYRITKRLSKLSNKMKMATENVFDAYNEEGDRTDEIGELASSYNYMVKRIATLGQEQYKLGQSIKSAELELLQAQINPHFLYNTMDMINWMSYDNRGEEIRKITKSLSTFYKLSLSKGNHVIPISDELKHVSLYMEIQNYRLQNVVDFKIECDDRLKGYMIPKITLQPIVENAVLHGILFKESKIGFVHITCNEIENNQIQIIVEDNGVGMNEEQLKHLMEYDSKQESGYGLKNIHTRLMLTFNEKSGLEIESEEGVGTKVTVLIPKIL
jgi:two-component system sensor histidine kinase YesM